MTIWNIFARVSTLPALCWRLRRQSAASAVSSLPSVSDCTLHPDVQSAAMKQSLNRYLASGIRPEVQLTLSVRKSIIKKFPTNNPGISAAAFTKNPIDYNLIIQ